MCKLSEEESVPDDLNMSDILFAQDVEVRIRDGRTLLINTAFYGREQVAAFLLKLGANVNAKDRRNYISKSSSSISLMKQEPSAFDRLWGCAHSSVVLQTSRASKA